MGKFGDDKYGNTIEDKKDKAIEMAVAAVKRAREYTDDVEFYSEDIDPNVFVSGVTMAGVGLAP